MYCARVQDGALSEKHCPRPLGAAATRQITRIRASSRPAPLLLLLLLLLGTLAVSGAASSFAPLVSVAAHENAWSARVEAPLPYGNASHPLGSYALRVFLHVSGQDVADGANVTVGDVEMEWDTSAVAGKAVFDFPEMSVDFCRFNYSATIEATDLFCDAPPCATFNRTIETVPSICETWPAPVNLATCNWIKYNRVGITWDWPYPIDVPAFHLYEVDEYGNGTLVYVIDGDDRALNVWTGAGNGHLAWYLQVGSTAPANRSNIHNCSDSQTPASLQPPPSVTCGEADSSSMMFLLENNDVSTGPSTTEYEVFHAYNDSLVDLVGFSTMTWTGLAPATTYDVYFRSVNSVGPGSNSSVLSCSTRNDAPPEMLIECTSINSDTAIVSPVVAPGIPGTFVEDLEVRLANGTIYTLPFVNETSTQLSFDIRNTTVNNTANFVNASVRGTNIFGTGEWSNWTVCTDPGGLPFQVTDVSCSSTKYTISAEWVDPGVSGGPPVHNYQIEFNGNSDNDFALSPVTSTTLLLQETITSVKSFSVRVRATGIEALPPFQNPGDFDGVPFGNWSAQITCHSKMPVPYYLNVTQHAIGGVLEGELLTQAPIIEIIDIEGYVVDFGTYHDAAVTLHAPEVTPVVLNATNGVANFSDVAIVAQTAGNAQVITASVADFFFSIDTALEPIIIYARLSAIVFWNQPGDTIVNATLPEMPEVRLRDAHKNMIISGPHASLIVSFVPLSVAELAPGVPQLTAGVENVTAVAGVAATTGLALAPPATDYYFLVTVYGDPVVSGSSNIFGVFYPAVALQIDVPFASTVFMENQIVASGDLPQLSLRDELGVVVASGPDAMLSVAVNVSARVPESGLVQFLVDTEPTVVGTVAFASATWTGRASSVDLIFYVVDRPEIPPVVVAGLVVDPVATTIAIDTQPLANVTATTLFPVQPAVRLLDARGELVVDGAQASAAVVVALEAPSMNGSLLVGATTAAFSGGIFAPTNLSVADLPRSNETLATRLNLTALGLSAVSDVIFVFPRAVSVEWSQQPVANVLPRMPLTTLPVVRIVGSDGGTVAVGPDAALAVSLAVTGGTGGELAAAGSDTAGLASGGLFASSSFELDAAASGNVYLDNVTLTASVVGLPALESDPMELFAVAVDLSLVVQPVADVLYGETFPQSPVVAAVDSSGAVVVAGPHAVLAVAESVSSGVTMSSLVDAPMASGIVTYGDFAIGASASDPPFYFWFNASATFDSVTRALSVVSGPMVVHPGATEIVFAVQPPAYIAAGAVIAPSVVVHIRDAAGNLITGGPHAILNVTIEPATTTGAFAPGTVSEVQAVAGVASGFTSMALASVDPTVLLRATLDTLAFQVLSTSIHVYSPVTVSSVASVSVVRGETFVDSTAFVIDSANVVSNIVFSTSNTGLFSLAPSISWDTTEPSGPGDVALEMTAGMALGSTSGSLRFTILSGNVALGPFAVTLSVVDFPAPRISSISPNPVGNCGRTVTLEGAYFGTSKSNLTGVFVDGEPCAQTTWLSAGSVTCRLPSPLTSNGTSVQVTAQADGKMSAARRLDLIERPVISAIRGAGGAPLTMPTLVTETVELEGRNLAETVVTVGVRPCIRVAAGNDTASDTLVRCRPRAFASAAMAPGGDVIATDANGCKSVAQPELFVSFVGPSISEIVPDIGASLGGYDVTINGQFLGSSAADVKYMAVADLNCTATMRWISSSTVVCQAPPTPLNIAVSGPVTIETRSYGSTASADEFRFVQLQPIIDSVQPTLVSLDGGIDVTIRGIGFRDESSAIATESVLLAGVPCTVDTEQSNEYLIVCAAQPTESTNGNSGPVTVKLSSGVSVDWGLFEYADIGGNVPIIAGVTPASGRFSGGDRVTITGKNLGFSPGDIVSATFDGVECKSREWTSSARIECDTPARNASGVVFVSIVTSSAGRSAIDGRFEYTYPAPVIVDFWPRQAAYRDGGRTITLTGRWFSERGEVPDVYVDDRACTQVEHLGDLFETITCSLPSHRTPSLASGTSIDAVELVVETDWGEDDIADFAVKMSYAPDAMLCDPRCGRHGDCDTGGPVCVCHAGWSGPPACEQRALRYTVVEPLAVEGSLDDVAEFELQLSIEPTSPVTVSLFSNDTSESTFEGEVVLTKSGAATRVVVEAVVDGLADGLAYFGIDLVVSSDDPQMNGIIDTVPLQSRDPPPTLLGVEPEVSSLNGTAMTVIGEYLGDSIRVRVGSVDVAGPIFASFSRRAVRHARQALIVSPVGYYEFRSPVIPDPGAYDVRVTTELGEVLTLKRAVFYTEDCPEEDQYGLGTDCKDCPKGGICPGGYRVWPEEGYWNPSETAGYVTKCADPPERCPGNRNGECGAGYTGVNCGGCATGYYETGGWCEECPASESFWIYLIFDLAVWFCIGISAVMLEDRENLSHVLAFFFQLQTIAGIGALLPNSLPSIIRDVYGFFYLFSGDVHFLKPDCQGRVPYLANFFVQLLYNIAIGLPMTVGVLIAKRVSMKRNAHRGSDAVNERRKHFANRFVRCLMIHLSIIYLPVATRSFETLGCSKGGDGKLYMITDNSFICFTGGSHIVAVAVSIILLIAFIIGYPVFMVMRMRQNAARLYLDHTFQERWDYLYEPYVMRFRFFWASEFIFNISLALCDTILWEHPTVQFGILATLLIINIILISTLKPYRRGWEGHVMLMAACTNLFAVFIVFSARTEVFSESGIVVAAYVLVALVLVVTAILFAVVCYVAFFSVGQKKMMEEVKMQSVDELVLVEDNSYESDWDSDCTEDHIAEQREDEERLADLREDGTLGKRISAVFGFSNNKTLEEREAARQAAAAARAKARIERRAEHEANRKPRFKVSKRQLTMMEFLERQEAVAMDKAMDAGSDDDDGPPSLFPILPRSASNASSLARVTALPRSASNASSLAAPRHDSDHEDSHLDSHVNSHDDQV